VNPDLVTIARDRGAGEIDRDLISIRWADGALIIWSGPASDTDRVIVREIPQPIPWGRK